MNDFLSKHPNVHQPAAKWSEEQTLHLVLAYNNPFRWKSRRKLANDSIRHHLNSPNVHVYVIELAHDKRAFDFAELETAGLQNLTYIQMLGDCEVWHKENLINLAVRHFPKGWKYGAYWDADFTCTRYDWALETIHMLQHYQFVQLFNTYADVTGTKSTSDGGHRPYRINTSFAYNFTHQEEFKAQRQHRLERRKLEQGDAHYGIDIPMGDVFPWGLGPGATGGGWAWRRQAFTTVGGWPDRCVLGSGDWHSAFGLIGQFGLNVGPEQSHCTPQYIQYVQNWITNAQRLNAHPGKGVIGCIDNFAVHHFHGSKLNRAYGERWQILKRNQFDPFADIVPDWQGVLRWTGTKPGLRDEVRKYFLSRNEDDTTLGASEKPMA